MDDPVLTFRPLTRDDFSLLVDWLARRHVKQWWGAPLDGAGVESAYGPCIDRTDPTEMFICLESGVPVGLLQIYRMADNPDYAAAVGITDAAGIDLLIGDEDRCGRGLGARIIAGAVELVWAHYPEVDGALAGPSVRNTRSLRAFEKAGLRALGPVTVPDEDDDEMIVCRSRPTAT